MFDQTRQVSRDDHTQQRATTESGTPDTGRKKVSRIRAAASAFLRRLPEAGPDCNRLAILTHGAVSEIVKIPRKASHAVALSGIDPHLFSISTRGSAAVHPHDGSPTARGDGRPEDITDSDKSSCSAP